MKPLTWKRRDDVGASAFLLPKTERVLRAVAEPGEHAFAEVLDGTKGFTLTPRQVTWRLVWLRDAGWIENVGSSGPSSRWRLCEAARPALVPGALPLYPHAAPKLPRAPAKAAKRAAPAARDIVPPRRENKFAAPVLSGPEWKPARAGALDHARIPSLIQGRSVPYWAEGAQ